MEELTNAVTEVDKKREEMLIELQYLEQSRYSMWFKMFCSALKGELEFTKRAHGKMLESNSAWSILAAKPQPGRTELHWLIIEATPIVTWMEELQAPSLKKEREEKRKSSMFIRLHKIY